MMRKYEVKTRAKITDQNFSVHMKPRQVWRLVKKEEETVILRRTNVEMKLTMAEFTGIFKAIGGGDIDG